jgi:hypothetical protein
VAGEQRDVAETLAKAGHAHGDDVHAIVQVLAELLLGHELGEIDVAREEYAYVNRFRLAAADGLEGALLQHAEQFHLHSLRSRVDLVEEDRPAICCEERPGLSAIAR